MKKLCVLLILGNLFLVGCGEKEEPPVKPVDPELEKAVRKGNLLCRKKPKKLLTWVQVTTWTESGNPQD